MSTPGANVPTSRRSNIVQRIAIFFVALVLGSGSLVCSLVAYDTPTPQLPVAISVFGVVYLVGGLFCGVLFPRYYWTTVLGLCAAAFLLSAVFGVLILFAGQWRQEDLDMLSLGALVTIGSFLGACIGVAGGGRLRRNQRKSR